MKLIFIDMSKFVKRVYSIRLQALTIYLIVSAISRTAQDSTTHTKIKFPIKDFFSKYGQIRWKLWIWSHLLNKSLMESFIFVQCSTSNTLQVLDFDSTKFSAKSGRLHNNVNCSCFWRLWSESRPKLFTDWNSKLVRQGIYDWFSGFLKSLAN